jgi:hypothetical protein
MAPQSSAARACAELAQLTEGGREELLRGEGSRLDALIQSRQTLAATLERLTPDERSKAALRRILDRDPELLALLGARHAALGRELQRLGVVRRSLESYRGRDSDSPLYVERLG